MQDHPQVQYEVTTRLPTQLYVLFDYVIYCVHRLSVNSLQRAGGIYSLVALSPSVGCYQGGTFGSNFPLRVIQPHMDVDTDIFYGIKEEEQLRKRKRQASLPCVRMSYEMR